MQAATYTFINNGIPSILLGHYRAADEHFFINYPNGQGVAEMIAVSRQLIGNGLWQVTLVDLADQPDERVGEEYFVQLWSAAEIQPALAVWTTIGQ